MTVREMSMWKKKKNSRSVNTEEALILGNPPPPSSPPCLDDDDDHHLFNPSLSSSPSSSTDRFDPIKNYPSISSLEIDSKNHSHHQQPMEEEDRMEVKKSSCSIVTGRLTKRSSSAIKERRKRSSVKNKRKNKEMVCSSIHSAESTSVVPTDEKRNSSFGTPQSKRLDCRDREFELMHPPGSHKKIVQLPIVDQPIDPNEPTYCVCHQGSHGDMIACDMDNCQGGEWFHYSCVGLTPETRFKGKWYCPTCKLLPFIVSKVKAIALEP